jgi:hypothetical protein
MFEIYKMRDGRAWASEFVLGKQQTRELLKEKKATLSQLNETQEELVRLRAIILNGNLRGKSQVFEDEAWALRMEVETKARYLELYRMLENLQGKIGESKEKSAQMRITLLSGFEEWYGKWERNELFPGRVFPVHVDCDTAQTKGKARTGQFKPGTMGVGRKK